MSEQVITPFGQMIEAAPSRPLKLTQEHPEAFATSEGFFHETPADVGQLRPIHQHLSDNASYAKYMQMHKVFVGNAGGRQLEGLFHDLKDESQPRYVSAGGWAAVESALVRSDIGTEDRLHLLSEGVAAWYRAFDMHISQEAQGAEVEPGFGHRVALDIATAPLLADMVAGDVKKETCERAFADCLAVASSNQAYLVAAKQAGDMEAVSCYSGMGYECNALLAFNRLQSQTWFIMPTMARCDSGYYYRGQTHDLLVIHQKHGRILSATPVEIKSKASLRDRRRYKALIVRGKMHLSVEGKTRPEHTLQAIENVYKDQAAPADDYIADQATERIVAMVRDYYAGKVLGKIASKNSVTRFHDASQVILRHPGLSRQAAVS